MKEEEKFRMVTMRGIFNGLIKKLGVKTYGDVVNGFGIKVESYKIDLGEWKESELTGKGMSIGNSGVI